MYSLTCFGRLHAHHQEFNNCSTSLWFYRWERGGSSAVGRGRAGWSVVAAVLLVVVGPVNKLEKLLYLVG
jgi:hypothetical protein